MGNDGPLHKLDGAKGDKVIVRLKNGSRLTGILRAFDKHLNMWLEEAAMDGDEAKTQYGTILVRGDNVVVVSPE